MEEKLRYRVIVVDDESMAVKAISRVIEKYCTGFEVVGTAQNGKEALDIIRGTDPDLVITDIAMPVMNGLELARQAKEELPDLCFVIISGYQDFEYMREAIRNGVLDYITKPIVPSAISIMMDRVSERLKDQNYRKRNELLRKICLGGTVPEKVLRKYFPYPGFYAALWRENGLPRRFSRAKEPEIFGIIDETYCVYGRDSMEQLFLIPEELLGENSLKDYMTRLSNRQKSADSYLTLLYYGEAFSVEGIVEKIHGLYHWLNVISTVGKNQVINLDHPDTLHTRPDAPGTAELDALMHELDSYIKKKRYDQLKFCLQNAYARWEQENRTQVWLEHASRRILNYIRMEAGDEASLLESEYMMEDAFYYATSVRMLVENLHNIFYRIQEPNRH